MVSRRALRLRIEGAITESHAVTDDIESAELENGRKQVEVNDVFPILLRRAIGNEGIEDVPLLLRAELFRYRVLSRQVVANDHDIGVGEIAVFFDILHEVCHFLGGALHDTLEGLIAVLRARL